jgi:hypothetical protein
MERVTNKAYTEDRVFQKACELAGVLPTPRQAAKYRNGKGAAFTFKHVASFQVTKAQGLRQRALAKKGA